MAPAPLRSVGSPEAAPLKINDRRQVVGLYIDAAGAYHGFLRDRKGAVTTLALDHAG